MEFKSMILTILFGAVLNIQFLSVQLATVERCLDGLYQKKTPSAERPEVYKDCLQWKDKSCCTAETAAKLRKNGEKDLIHFDWNHCGDLSQACKKYMENQVCFYQCEPNIVKWAWNEGKGFIRGIPICSSYCDKWFEACKNDMTYSENWFYDYILNSSKHGPIHVSSKCRTFADIFQSGEGLCNRLWGPSYKYEKTPNCMVMDFEGANPNDKVTKTE